MENPIIRFSFKSSILVCAAAFLSSFILPIFLSGFIDSRLVTVVCNALILGFAVAYSRYFIDSKQGFSKKFFKTYAIFGISFAVITYFWLYLGNYI